MPRSVLHRVRLVCRGRAGRIARVVARTRGVNGAGASRAHAACGVPWRRLIASASCPDDVLAEKENDLPTQECRSGPSRASWRDRRGAVAARYRYRRASIRCALTQPKVSPGPRRTRPRAALLRDIHVAVLVHAHRIRDQIRGDRPITSPSNGAHHVHSVLRTNKRPQRKYGLQAARFW